MQIQKLKESLTKEFNYKIQDGDTLVYAIDCPLTLEALDSYTNRTSDSVKSAKIESGSSDSLEASMMTAVASDLLKPKSKLECLKILKLIPTFNLKELEEAIRPYSGELFNDTVTLVLRDMVSEFDKVCSGEVDEQVSQ